MIWILRHIGVHLWLTALFVIPVSFYIMPRFTRFGLGINPIFFGVFLYILLGGLIGFFMHRSAKKRVASLLREGQAWERSGLVEKAKEKYILALRAYDTFLMGPFLTQKTALKISRVIAGFQVNNSIENQNFKLGTAVYLRMNPKDADIAALWLSQISQTNIVSSFEQEVLYGIAQAHMENIRLLPLLVNIFLGLQKNDLIAKKIYQQVMTRPDLAKKYQNRICELMDEPEEKTMRQAVFSIPEPLPEKRFEIRENAFKLASSFLSSIKTAGGFVWVSTKFVVHHVVLFISRAVLFLKAHEKLRAYLKTGLLAIFLSGFLFFVVSTLFHTFKTRVIKQKKTAQEDLIHKPFTIQVAAYLKRSHAQNYVDNLKKKQIDASVKKVEGGGKTWFVISVSQFADKKSAAEYGKHLKQQHLIDDFFVNNR